SVALVAACRQAAPSPGSHTGWRSESRLPASAPLGPTRQFAKRRNHRPVARTVPGASFTVEGMIRMTGAGGPSCVHECVLEVLLNLVDALPRTILTVPVLHAFREAPYDGHMLLTEGRGHVLSQEQHRLVERRIAGGAQILLSGFIDEFQPPRVELRFDAHDQGLELDLVFSAELVRVGVRTAPR